MMEGWQLKTIGEVCDVVNGGTPKTGIEAYWRGLHHWITPAEMGRRSNPYIGQTERTITDEGLRNSSARLLPPYSIILSSRAPIGHLVINTTPMATNQGCKGLVPLDNLYYKYIFYYLMSIVPLLNELGNGATFKELSGGNLKKVPIPVPPLPEQQRIVGILDEAFEDIARAKANAEKNIQNARELFDSYLQLFFDHRSQANNGWQPKKIIDVCSVINGGTPKTGNAAYWNGPHQWITPAEMGKNKNPYISKTKRTITDEGLRDSSARLLPPHSVILSSRAPIGYLAINTVPMATNQGCKGLIPTNGLDHKYLYYHLVRSVSLLNELGTGATFNELSGSKLKGVPIYVPPLPEQHRIVVLTDKIKEETQHLETFYQQKLASLDELKKSLLDQAFSGQL